MYIGGREIQKTTPKGEYVHIKFLNGEELLTSLEYIEQIKSDKPLDATKLAEKEELFITEELYKLLLKHNVKVISVNKVLDRLVYSLNMNTEKKFAQLLGMEVDERRVLDIK